MSEFFFPNSTKNWPFSPAFYSLLFYFISLSRSSLFIAFLLTLLFLSSVKRKKKKKNKSKETDQDDLYLPLNYDMIVRVSHSLSHTFGTYLTNARPSSAEKASLIAMSRSRQCIISPSNYLPLYGHFMCLCRDCRCLIITIAYHDKPEQVKTCQTRIFLSSLKN